MTETPTAEAVEAWTLGDRVTVDHRLVRRAHDAAAAHLDKRWDLEKLPDEVEGIVVGVRTLSNGSQFYDHDDGWLYTPDAFFRAVLVATDLRRKPFLVLYATKVGADA